jgi:two-component system LytT family response regulator
MQDGTGFDVLDGINYEYYSVVFITAFQEYALTAFKFNAIDFLLKPVDPKDLMSSVQCLDVSL